MLGAFSQIPTAKPLLISSSSSPSLSSPSQNGKSLKSSSQSFPLASRIFVRRFYRSPLQQSSQAVKIPADLSYSTSEASLIKLFSRFGHIIDVQLPRHEESKHLKGYAFIQYCSQEEAILAVEDIDHKAPFGVASSGSSVSGCCREVEMQDEKLGSRNGIFPNRLPVHPKRQKCPFWVRDRPAAMPNGPLISETWFTECGSMEESFMRR